MPELNSRAPYEPKMNVYERGDSGAASSSGKTEQSGAASGGGSANASGYAGAATAATQAVGTVLQDITKRRHEARLRELQKKRNVRVSRFNTEVKTANLREDATQGAFASMMRNQPGFRR